MDEFGYVVNVDCAVFRDGEYCCIERAAEEEHAAGELGLPGGKLEADAGTVDAIERTAAREVREEVGVEVGDVRYVTSSTFALDTGQRCLQVVTLGEYEGGEAHARQPAEVAAVHWLTPGELATREDVPPYVQRDVEAVEAVREQ